MCRENSGLSQEYAAGLLHIAPRTLSDYENDKTTVPDDIVMAMGKIYDTNFLVWWHLKYRTPYGEILPEIYEPSTVGDMMFSYVLARDATDDSYESFKDVYEERQLQISEIPRLEEAIRMPKSSLGVIPITVQIASISLASNFLRFLIMSQSCCSVRPELSAINFFLNPLF